MIWSHLHLFELPSLCFYFFVTSLLLHYLLIHLFLPYLLSFCLALSYLIIAPNVFLFTCFIPFFLLTYFLPIFFLPFLPPSSSLSLPISLSLTLTSSPSLPHFLSPLSSPLFLPFFRWRRIWLEWRCSVLCLCNVGASECDVRPYC